MNANLVLKFLWNVFEKNAISVHQSYRKLCLLEDYKVLDYK